MKNAFIADVYPDKSQYGIGEKVCIQIDYVYTEAREGVLVIEVYQGLSLLDTMTKPVTDKPGNQTAVIYIQPKATDWQGYGVDVAMYEGGECLYRFSTAFDVVADWRQAIRYGFVCDFDKEDEGDSSGIERLRKYHINTVQFYDWMYRHENLVPDIPYYTDAMGRQLSIQTVRDKIAACHRYNMRAMAYGAVYACTGEFYEAHRDWGMYQNDGKAVSLDNWLYLMDISPDSPWTGHMCGEFRRALEALDFDGIHLDTYGFPKKAYVLRDGQKELMDLSRTLPAFIDRVADTVKQEDNEKAVTFNNVGNWPTTEVARSGVDAVYIEVWDPSDRYYDLYRIITEARRASDKPIILAAYIKPFSLEIPFAQQETCMLLTSAVIFASGGFHLVLGEYDGVLNDPYFVQYTHLLKEQTSRIRSYFDFVVRYGDLLLDPGARDISMTHANGINDEFVFSGCLCTAYGESGKVWTLVKETEKYYIINLINLCEVGDYIWHTPKRRPRTVHGITIDILVEERIGNAYVASPDMDGGTPKQITMEQKQKKRGLAVRIKVDMLDIWNVVFLEKSDL